jgi:hypothetical protein
MLRTTRLKTVFLSLLGLGVAGFLSLFYRALHTRHVAEECMRGLQVLRVGKASFEEIEEFRRQYASYIIDKPGTCTSEACSFSVGFDNRISFLTHRESGLAASIAFRKGSLEEVYFGASCAGADRKPPYVPTFVVMVRQSISNPQFRGGPAGSGNGFVFDLGPDATEEQIARVYGLNLSFLDHLGGCRDATEMFKESPAQWRRSLWGQGGRSESSQPD